MNFETSVQIVDLIKGITQVLFWMVAGSVAVFSFMQARKSIFQPAKNEVFKIQISDMKNLINALNWKSSSDAFYFSGIQDSFRITIYEIFKEYAKEKFDAHVRSEWGEKNKSVGIFVSNYSNNLRLIKSPAEELDEEDEISKWKSAKHNWSTYEWEKFCISYRQKESQDLLNSAANNPIFPKSIISRIEDINKEIYDTSKIIALDVESIVREFPKNYPTEKDVLSVDLTWANNKISVRGEGIYDKYILLEREIRLYLKSDELFI